MAHRSKASGTTDSPTAGGCGVLYALGNEGMCFGSTITLAWAAISHSALVASRVGRCTV